MTTTISNPFTIANAQYQENYNYTKKQPETAGTIAYKSVETAGTIALFKPVEEEAKSVETAGTIAYKSVETAGTIASGSSNGSSSSGSLSVVA